MKQWDGRISLAMKLNMVIIASILISTLGLIMVSLGAYSFAIDRVYSEEADEILDRAARHIDTDLIENLIYVVGTRNYRQVFRDAQASGDETRIIDWMTKQPSANPYKNADPNQETSDRTLYDDYTDLYKVLYATAYPAGCDDLYLQYERSGISYSLVQAYENMLFVGKTLEEGPEFDNYQDNEAIKSTIYRKGDRWYFIKSKQVIQQSAAGEDVTVCTLNITYDVNAIITGRHMFVLYSLLFSVLVIAVVIALSTWIVRKNVTKPLVALSKGAKSFGREDDGYSEENIISLKINTDDEIEDLYDEIHSMQTRIVNYTEHLKTVTAEKERVTTELRMASSIQEAMLPSTFPAFPERKEFDLFASMDPAKEVGGDFYDFLLIDKDHLAVLIADVSEKGVPAALFMMSSKILLDYRIKMGGSPGEMLTAVNREIAEHNDSKMFVTVWLGILDLTTGQLVCSNAGHEFPAIRSGNGPFTLFEDEHGLVIGGLAQTQYKDYTLTLRPGDSLFVYTDGVTDAKNEQGVFYGTDRMIGALNRAPQDSPEQIIQFINADIEKFMGSAQQFDDLTMLCLTYKGPGEDENTKEKAD